MDLLLLFVLCCSAAQTPNFGWNPPAPSAALCLPIAAPCCLSLRRWSLKHRQQPSLIEHRHLELDAPCRASSPPLRRPPRSWSSCSPIRQSCRPRLQCARLASSRVSVGSVPVSTNVSPASCVERCFFSAVMSTPASFRLSTSSQIRRLRKKLQNRLRDARPNLFDALQLFRSRRFQALRSTQTPAPATPPCVRPQSESPAPSARARVLRSSILRSPRSAHAPISPQSDRARSVALPSASRDRQRSCTNPRSSNCCTTASPSPSMFITSRRPKWSRLSRSFAGQFTFTQR